MTTRIQDAFDRAKSENRAAFIGYLPAGYPSKDSFLEHAKVLLESADLLEIGLPYSDPLGDGPTIQRASEVALLGGMTVEGTFEQARAVRAMTNKPLLIMTYYNPILATGEEAFVSSAVAAGVDGLILPDLPPDEADTLIPLATAAGLKLTFLLAPTSTEDRIKLVLERSCLPKCQNWSQESKQFRINLLPWVLVWQTRKPPMPSLELLTALWSAASL
jgi:tryptophan synthase alpha chain